MSPSSATLTRWEKDPLDPPAVATWTRVPTDGRSPSTSTPSPRRRGRRAFRGEPP
jgi:hypothetical protein